MPDWILLAAPLLIAAITLALTFVGCQFEVSPLPQRYPDLITTTRSLVSYWRLGEAPGATVAADSKDGNAGTYKGGVTLGVPGLLHDHPGTAAQFDGHSSYVSVPHRDMSLNPPKFTVEALVMIAGGDGTLRAIVSSRDGNQFGYSLYVSTDNRWEASIGDGSTLSVDVAVGKPDAVKVGAGPPRGPYYVAVTYDGSVVVLYVNPMDPADPDQVAHVPVSMKPNTRNELRIGAGANEFPIPGPQDFFFFNGVINEVAIYNDALDFETLVNHFAVMSTGQGIEVHGGI